MIDSSLASISPERALSIVVYMLVQSSPVHPIHKRAYTVHYFVPIETDRSLDLAILQESQSESGFGSGEVSVLIANEMKSYTAKFGCRRR
jgi:hypothetical protein